MPAVRFVDTFHDDPHYIRACARSVNDYWQKNGRPDRLLLSFHGVPKRALNAGDPYHCLCHVTARLVAHRPAAFGDSLKLCPADLGERVRSPPG